MYRESLQEQRRAHPDEQAPGDHRLRRADRVLARRRCWCRSPTPARSSRIYKELEFFSLLKELGPSEDTRRARFRSRSTSAEEIAACLGRDSGGRSRSRWRSRLPTASLPIAWQPGEARARSAQRWRAPAVRCSKTPRSPKIAVRRERRCCSTLDKAGIHPARLRARRHALRLPAGCRSVRLRARRAGRGGGSNIVAAARPSSTPTYLLELYEHPAPQIEARGLAQALSRDRAAPGRACWRAWSATASASIPPSWRGSPD